MKVRFAPSPTGVLHIGGARTALYNWLLARGQGGTFVLRIEDTDRERSTPENVEQILDALRWLEPLDWDEGRLAGRARPAARWSGSSSCSPGARLRGRRRGAPARKPDEGETVFHDQIRGEIATPNSAIQDFVIRRSDGSALYNPPSRSTTATWASPRSCAADHISNTPRQVMILRALGEEPPAYAHLPLLQRPDGKKLSKRHGAASVQELRAAGYLPEAVRNYIALLGWGYDESTTFTTDELIEHFDLSRVSKNPAVFDEQKLRWMNGRYLREPSRS